MLSSLAAGALGFSRLGCLVFLDRLALFEIGCVSMMMFKHTAGGTAFEGGPSVKLRDRWGF